jgi:hypothetical protein
MDFEILVAFFDSMKNILKRPIIAEIVDKSDDHISRMLIIFTNGYSLSIIHGSGTYSDSQEGLFEIAPYNNDGKMDGSLFDKKDIGDDVLGYCDIEKIKHYVNKLGNLK